MIKKRNTLPRNIVSLPKENYKAMSDDELNAILSKINEMRSEDLLRIMSAVSNGLIHQRDMASYRALDFELALVNIATNPTPRKYRFVIDEFIEPHEKALRSPGLLDILEKKTGKYKNK